MTPERMETLIGDWATAPEPLEARADAVVTSVLTTLPRQNRPTPRWYMGGGLALAASLAAAVLLSRAETSQPQPSAPTIAARQTGTQPKATAANAYATEAETFSALFIPTPEEEEYL